MTKKEIDQVFTKIILECLNAGYVINSQTFMGSDGTARIDMRKNNRFIRIFLKTIYGSGSDCIQLAMGTLEFASERELEQSSVIFTDRLEIKEVCLLKEIQKDLWIIASGNPDIEKNKLV